MTPTALARTILVRLGLLTFAFAILLGMAAPFSVAGENCGTTFFATSSSSNSFIDADVAGGCSDVRSGNRFAVLAIAGIGLVLLATGLPLPTKPFDPPRPSGPTAWARDDERP